MKTFVRAALWAVLPVVVLSASRSLADVSLPVESIASQLQSKTSLPVLVPSIVPRLNRIYTRISARDNRYNIQLVVTPDCGGGTVCSFGSFGGDKGGKLTQLSASVLAFNPRNKVEPIELDKGVKGQFINSCGAYCLAIVEWQQGDVIYRAVIKNGRKEDVVRLANSAIEGGVRTASTQTSKPQSSWGYTPTFLYSQDSSSPINIRDGASTDAYARHIGYSGDRVKVLEETKGGDRQRWYRVQFQASGATGWVRGDFVRFVNEGE